MKLAGHPSGDRYARLSFCWAFFLFFPRNPEIRRLLGLSLVLRLGGRASLLS
ncbi:hypothetical protein [Alkalihalobacillus pseudalcaliphilus]|uniref:hypothetical protein n=1 Tax=Alkalihalobacillus pseudalcaliphilus TaxID=79884 RepID=UPI00236165B0|nr:hypothetical protein [Alkalihalobacillus pseudalcaliphilus]